MSACAPKYLDYLQYKENSSRSILIPDGVAYFWSLKIIFSIIDFSLLRYPYSGSKIAILFKIHTLSTSNQSSISFTSVQTENSKLRLEFKITSTNVTEKLFVIQTNTLIPTQYSSISEHALHDNFDKGIHDLQNINP